MKMKTLLITSVIAILIITFMLYSGNLIEHNNVFSTGFVHGFLSVLIIGWIVALLICFFRSMRKERPIGLSHLVFSIGMIILFSSILIGFHYLEDRIVAAIIIPIVIIATVVNFIYFRKVIRLYI